MQLGVRSAADLLNVSEKTIYRWIKEGKLPGYRVNDQYRFNRAELLEWATSNKINVSPALLSEEPSQAAGQLPTLLEALRSGGIHYRVPGNDKSQVLAAVVELMHLPQEVNRQFLLQVLLARESLGSTGIGDGVAIPHVRNPIVMHIPQPTITLCMLERPVDFAAMDGKPVHTLFTIVSPTIRAHLHLLSRLAFCLQQDAVKHALGQQLDRDGIMAAIANAEAQLPGQSGTGVPPVSSNGTGVPSLSSSVSSPCVQSEETHGRDADATHGQDGRATEENHGQDAHATHTSDGKA
jgi:PTS system nitrogen regulatory IIA component